MSSFESGKVARLVRSELVEHVLVIKLNRPEVLNAVNLEMAPRLRVKSIVSTTTQTREWVF